MPGFLDGNAPKALYAAVASLTVRIPGAFGGRRNHPRYLGFYTVTPPPALSRSPTILFSSTLPQAGLGIAIAIVINVDLWDLYWYAGYYNNYYSDTCFLTPPDESWNLCYFNWATTALAIFFSIFLLIFTVCNKWRNPKVTGIIMVIGLGWWILAAVLNTVYGDQANNSTDPDWQDKEGSRNAVIGMSWACVGLFTVGLVLSLADCQNAKKYQQPVGAYQTGQYAGGYGAAPPPQTQAPPPPFTQPGPPPPYTQPSYTQPQGYPQAAYGQPAYGKPSYGQPAAGYDVKPPYPTV